ncbi:MAG: single-stranded DNA-binding protein [Bdellovibrionales bacterium]|nr:single-stranded DNA-binding protein [Bdellovibrionales bacterium]
MIVGNLTRDPELKTLPSGMKVTSFSLATNRVWMKDGQKQESVDYHNIVVFGRQAETSAQYLKKGSQALIEGRLQTRSWDDAGTGKKMYRTEIVADRVQFGRRSDGSSPAPSSDDSSQAPDDGFDGVDTIDYPEEDINPEDIPF